MISNSDFEKLIDAAIIGAVKETVGESMKPKQKSATNATPVETAKRTAELAGMFYRAYLAEGFSGTQAFELTKTAMLIAK